VKVYVISLFCKFINKNSAIVFGDREMKATIFFEGGQRNESNCGFFFWEGRTEMKSNWIVEYNFYKMGE
jgi:hypothetical protein